MAELFALGASVATFVELTERVISLAKGYLEALRNAPATIHAIFVHISTLRAVLEGLAILTESGNQLPLNIVQYLITPGGVIDLCRTAVAELKDLLPDDVDLDKGSTRTTQRKRKRVQAAELMTRLAWPLKEGRALKKLDEIKGYSQSITHWHCPHSPCKRFSCASRCITQARPADNFKKSGDSTYSADC